MKSALLASIALIAFTLSPPLVAPLQAQDGSSEPQSEILVLEPASGDNVRMNPVQLKGRVEGARLDRILIQSDALAASVRLRDRRFRFPFFLFADQNGKALPATLSGKGAAPAALELDLDSMTAEEAEALIQRTSAELESDDANPARALDATRTTLRAGHPLFASILLGRTLSSRRAGLEFDDETAQESALLGVEVAVVLGHEDAARKALAKVPEPSDERKQLRATGERLFHASDLALVTGMSHKLAAELLDRGNLYFQEAGLLPRRLLKGY